MKISKYYKTYLKKKKIPEAKIEKILNQINRTSLDKQEKNFSFLLQLFFLTSVG